jgi:hypothetical protein
VMLLRPVTPHEQPQRSSRSRCRSPCAASRRTISDLIKQCSPHLRWARHPSSDQLSQPTSRGTVFRQDSTSRNNECSPAGRLAHSQNR